MPSSNLYLDLFLGILFFYWLIFFSPPFLLHCSRVYNYCCLVNSQGVSVVVVWGPLIAVASLVAEPGLQGVWAWSLWHTGLVAPWLSCGIFPDQGLNSCPLHWGFSTTTLLRNYLGLLYESVEKFESNQENLNMN